LALKELIANFDDNNLKPGLMDKDIKLNKSLKKLKKMASSYSFGRILGLISYIENTSISESLGQKFKAPSERLTNSEIAFLGALWLENYKNNNGFLWKKEDDIQKLREIYRLMDLYHKSLKSKQYGKMIREIAVYEGDGGYGWQFIELATLKYKCVKSELKQYYNVNLDVLPNFYEKLRNYFMRNKTGPNPMEFEQYAKDGKNAFNLFQLTKEEFESIFNTEEIVVAKMFISKLGLYKGKVINDIFDFNEFNSHPIVELPNGNLLIINFNSLARAIYESPYYWIYELQKKGHHELLVRLGKGSENAAINILQRIGFNPISDILINKSKKETTTDIDILIVHDKDAVVFQIKSKKLTLEAKHGVEEKIDDDFDKAVIKAYKQGVYSVESLINKNQHKELQDIKGLENIDKYHIICLTSDYYPTITPTCLLYQDPIASNEFPLVGMTLLDLSSICSLLDTDTFINYLNFREECTRMKIYGDNEMSYLGKYIEPIIDRDRRIYKYQRLPNDYGLLIDAILPPLHDRGVNQDVFNYLLKHLMYIENDAKYINRNTSIGKNLNNILDHLSKENIM